jgi:single-stranded-DNA-specific exonuclease
MHSASLALEMLTTLNSARATELALELERLNQERSNIQNQIWDEVRAQVEKGLASGKYRHGIAVANPGWHEGVVGIVASRVTETFRKPAAVIALREDFGKGSVRSFGGKDVLAALRECSSLLLGFGGHKYAAGLSVGLESFDEFADAFDRALGQIQEESHARSLYVEGACSIEELDVRSLQELERLGPFGPGNPEPIFTIRASVKNHRILKGRHLKLNLGSVGSMIEAIWFHGAEKKEVAEGNLLEEEIEWAGVPELNRFRGQMTPTLRVRDWRRIGD